MNVPGRRPSLGLDRFSALYLWALFIVVFGIWSPHEFLTSSTVHSVATEQAISAMIAIAVLIPLACGEFDLSVGANANFTGIVAILVQTNLHWGVVPSVVFSIFLGFLIGALNGLIVVRLGVSSFIATLGMGSILTALQVIVTGSLQPPPVTSNAWNKLTQYSIHGTQIVVVYMLVLAALAWWFLQHTPAGRYIFAAGGNREAARLSAVRVDWWSWSTLAISGTIAGLSGVLYTSLTGPSLTFGSSLLLPAFAAAFLGSTQLQPGRFNVWGTLIAIYVLATGVEGLELVSGAQWLSDMFNGVALILAVALAVGRQRRMTKGASKRSAAGALSPEEPTTAAQTVTDTTSEPLMLEGQAPGRIVE
jgi:ribose transport system permease protein